MATGSTAAPLPPAFGFALINREANALNFSITNIPANVRHMRILAVDNTSPSGEMIREVVPMPAVGSDLAYRLGGLTLGHKYDVRLSIYDSDFELVDEEELTDKVPASAPPKPVLNGLVNRDEGLFQMEVNVGSSVGDEITRIVSNIYDKINDVLTSQVHSIAGTIPTDRKVVISLNLIKDREYKITVSSMNKIGDSPLSDNMSLTASDLPNNPSAVAFGLINNELKATWTKPADAETFANLKFDVKFILKWGAGTTAGEAVFAQSAVNAVAGSGGSRYANVNQFTAGFSQAEIDAFLATQPLAAQDSRLLSVVCRISSKAGAFVRDSRDYLESGSTVSFLNVPQSVADSIASKISVVASLSTRASASAVPSLSLAASKTSPDRTSIAAMTWFNKVIFNAKYTQSDADADGDDEETDLSLTVLNTQQTSNSTPVPLNGSVYAPSDSASIAFHFEDVNGVKSPVFTLSAQQPQNPSVLGAAGMDSPKCHQGMLERDVAVSQGNSQSMEAEATLKITGQAPATARTTSPVSLVADPDNAGSYKLSFPFTALTNLQQGDSVDVVIKLYERFGNASSPRVVFSSSSLYTVTYRNENFSSLIVQGPTALEMFVCDLQANPQSISDYAAFIGFNKAAYAGAQGSNRDRTGAADGNEVEFALESGASPKYVEFSLKASSATYLRHVNNAQEALLPVDLRVAIDCDRLEVPSATDLDAAKARSGFTGVLANFIWFKCVRSSLAPGLVEFAVVASRVINGVRYNSSNEVSATITDPAFIQTIGKSLQATADGVAIPISFNGNSSVSIKIVRVPVIGDGEQASTVSEYTGTVVPADLVGGYHKVYFATPSSAYIVAMSTVGSANSLIVKLIQSSGASPTAVLPAPQRTGPVANQTVLH